MSYKSKKQFRLNLLGGSYDVDEPITINRLSGTTSQYIIERLKIKIFVNENPIVNTPEQILYKGIIQESDIIPGLNGKQVILKYLQDKFDPLTSKILMDSKTQMNIELENLRFFKLDEKNNINIINNIVPLLLVLKEEQLLVYDFYNKFLMDFYEHERSKPEIYNLKNIKSMMIQLFIILYKLVLAPYNIAHNNISGYHIIYDIVQEDKVVIKLIDFNDTLHIGELNDNSDNQSNKLISNEPKNITPETIVRYLKLSTDKKLHPELNLVSEEEMMKSDTIQKNNFDSNFNRWYYYPFISIFSLLLCNKELWTGNPEEYGIFKLMKPPENKSKYEYYFKIIDYLLDPSLVKKFIFENLTEEIKQELIKSDKLDRFKQIFNILIDEMCKGNTKFRMIENYIISFINDL